MKLCQGGVLLPGGSDLFGTRDAYCALGKINVGMGTVVHLAQINFLHFPQFDLFVSDQIGVADVGR
jgi:hypothetical protein